MSFRCYEGEIQTFSVVSVELYFVLCRSFCTAREFTVKLVCIWALNYSRNKVRLL